MARSLPLLPHQRAAHTRCAYCPKLCRFACPVSREERRETTTPWGKMTLAHQLDRGLVELDRHSATPLYACSGCLRCSHHCAHENPVAETLFAARAAAFDRGQAPAGAARVVAGLRARLDRACTEGGRLFPNRAVLSDWAYVPGCTALGVDPGEAAAGWELTAQAIGRAPRVLVDACCGMPLLEAGDRRGFERHARALLASLSSAAEAVFLDPGCLLTLRSNGASLGLGARQLTGLRHWSELAGAAPASHPTTTDAEPVRYHDACRLGRGLGLYDAPRALLTRARGAPPLEFTHSRGDGLCTGGGGLLPATLPETARAMAQRLTADHKGRGGGTIVTGCPGAAHQLRRAGAGALGLATAVLGHGAA